MESNESNRNPFLSAHLPLTLLAIAAIMFFASQLGGIKQGSKNMKWQSENADKVLKNLTEANTTLEKNVETRKALVAQSEQLQKQFSDLMKELDELGRAGDKDADLIIKTYGIKINDPTPSSGGAVTAPPAGEKPAGEKPAGDKPAETPKPKQP